MRHPYRKSLVAFVLMGALLASSGLVAASAGSLETWPHEAKTWHRQDRLPSPEDRYAMAGGCYALRTRAGDYVLQTDDGYAATARRASKAEPFHFQATELGRYLLYGADSDFLAASEGVIGAAAYGATRSTPGQIAGGLVGERTDQAARELAHSEANHASGRGASVVAAAGPSELADWDVEAAGDGLFTFHLRATEQRLSVGDGGTLELTDRRGDPFALELTGRCAKFPEIPVNVDGPLVGGRTFFQEVRGFMDLHLHMMAFEFLGGRARCGRPWHRYGVTHALVDCPDHEGQGYGGALEHALRGIPRFRGHSTDGWPSFEGWPRWDSYTHEQIYYRWMERAWRGGLRLFTNLLVDNGQLCDIYPFKRNSCNEMDGVRLQAKRIRQLENYIDAQSGGPGEGWFRIVRNPFEARRVINEGKLAVVLGIEVSVPLDCGLDGDQPKCDLRDIEPRLDEVYDLGVRQMELVNKFDNAFSGVAGDGGSTGMVVNQGNRRETGRYWQMETCPEDRHPHAHDKQQMNLSDDAGTAPLTGRDALAGAIFAEAGKSGLVPLYPQGPHCNIRGLSELGQKMIAEMVERGMIFDPDHMSALAQKQALDLLEGMGYSGVVSSHGWSNSTIYKRIYELGGVVTPYAGGSAGFAKDWEQHRAWADPRYYFGFGYGADTNGFGQQGSPREGNKSNPVRYPFTGFGGTEIARQVSGTRDPYDINDDGVAHYGLYPDWIEDLRMIAGQQIVEDMARGPEAYLQMWERAIGIAPDSCRPDVADLSVQKVQRLAKGMAVREVLELLGQPATRTDTEFTYCMSNDRTVTVSFAPDGTVQDWGFDNGRRRDGAGRPG